MAGRATVPRGPRAPQRRERPRPRAHSPPTAAPGSGSVSGQQLRPGLKSGFSGCQVRGRGATCLVLRACRRRSWRLMVTVEGRRRPCAGVRGAPSFLRGSDRAATPRQARGVRTSCLLEGDGDLVSLWVSTCGGGAGGGVPLPQGAACCPARDCQGLGRLQGSWGSLPRGLRDPETGAERPP